MVELLKYFKIGLKSELDASMVEVEDCGRYDARLSDYSVMCPDIYLFEIQEWIQVNIRRNADHCIRTLGINPTAVFKLIALDKQIYFTEEMLKNYGGVENFLRSVSSGNIEEQPAVSSEELADELSPEVEPITSFGSEVDTDYGDADPDEFDALVAPDELQGEVPEDFDSLEAPEEPQVEPPVYNEEVQGEFDSLEEEQLPLAPEPVEGPTEVPLDEPLTEPLAEEPPLLAEEVKPVDMSDAVEHGTASGFDDSDFEDETIGESETTGVYEAGNNEYDSSAPVSAPVSAPISAPVTFKLPDEMYETPSRLNKIEDGISQISNALAMIQSYMLSQSAYGLKQDEVLRDEEREITVSYLNRVSPYLMKDFFIHLAKTHENLAELTHFFNLFVKYAEEVTSNEQD